MIKISVCVLLICQIITKLIVHAPHNVSDYFNNKYGSDGIPYSIANYGHVPYGKSISGQISIPSVWEDCIYEQLPSGDRSVVLVKRDDCTFTQKTINVEREGGRLAIIVDNIVQKPGQVIMADDGRGSSVHIPTILIS